MIKEKNHECRRLGNVEENTNLQEKMMPTIEIQVEKLDSTDTLHSQEKEAGSRSVPSTVFLTCAAVESENNDLPLAPPSPKSSPTAAAKLGIHNNASEASILPSAVLDIFSGATTASTADSTGSPSSFVPHIPETWCMSNNNITTPDETDEESVVSTSYFDSSDFSPYNWTEILTEHEVMVGLAVVYLTISLTHPLLFLAGALTALSTATAVGAGYDCVCGFPSSSDSTTVTATEEESKIPAVVAPDGVGLVPMVSPDTCRTTTEAASMETGTQAGKVSDAVPSTMGQTTTLAQPTQTKTLAQPTIVSPCTSLVSATSFATTAMQKQQADVLLREGWIPSHYPPLGHAVIEKHEFFGLNVNQFFQVFLADDAPYHYKEFQKKRGDKNIHYGNWKNVHQDNNNDDIVTTSTAPLSMHPSADLPFPPELDCSEFITRTLSFQAKTNNSLFGPPYASTTKKQRLMIVNKRFGILEAKTTLADIPFCDGFFIMERWILTAQKGETDGNYRCQISTSCQVFFVKSCPFQSQIRTKTISSITDVSKAWLHMATQALALSEQHKQKRIRQEQHEYSLDDGEEDKRCMKKSQKEETSKGNGRSGPVGANTLQRQDLRTLQQVDEAESQSIQVSAYDLQKNAEQRRCDIEESPQTPPRRHPSQLKERILSGRRRTLLSLSSSSTISDKESRNRPLSRIGRFLSPQRGRESRKENRNNNKLEYSRGTQRVKLLDQL